MTLALDRGIQILTELGNAQGLTLSELSQRTLIPKSTTHRLLKRLCEQGLVRQNLLDQRYRSNVLLPQQTEIHIPPAEQPLIEIICRHAEALTDQVLWPSDIFIPIDDRLVLVESTRALTRLHLTHCRIQTQVDLLRSAAGRALLAFSEPDVCERYLRQAWQSTRCKTNDQQHFSKIWPAMREQIRQQGFAFRAPSYFGERESSDELRAIAAPLVMDGKVRACINLVWPKLFASEAVFAKDYAQPLLTTVSNIQAQLNTL
ncbi:IclR family transcriptional regulator [Marinomonas fungiae]|uniref:Transcriptional regulator, IclR family n=1 Tax=Marinomonas fungiae TaxID=1137284 RepID=A0A0K6IN49_9GAMM|nr:helix-turn-helix domain-containing protein [Marinomonas fungiae]CUB04516.1 transcriptional regulator, IclR family [Marinomonas fungiae]